MTDLPPGVTRYPLPRGLDWRFFTPWFAGMVGLALLVVLVVALVQDASVPVLVLVVLLGVAVPPVCIVVPTWARLVVLAVLATLVVGWLVRTYGEQDRGVWSIFAFVTALGLGALGLARLVGERRWRARMASGVGAPASGLDPTGGADVGVLATWRDREHAYEAVDPSPEVVLGAVRALDGRDHSVVTVYRGRARLDVGGDAGGPVVVQQADDRRRWGGHQVADPEWEGPVPARRAHRDPSLTTVTFAGAEMPYPAGLLTSIESAETAVRTWVTRGVRDESLTWWTPTGRPGIQRPGRLREEDRPGSTYSATSSVLDT